MINLLIYGIGGKMGKNVQAIAEQKQNFKVVCGVDKSPFGTFTVPVYTGLSNVLEKVDVLIDFSRPDALDEILEYCVAKKVPAILCTTGYTQEDNEKILKASTVVPMFRSANMSLGVNVLSNVLKQFSSILKDYDIEIIEKHHNQKVDAPSGTALMLANSINVSLENKKEFVYGRNGVDCKRNPNELTIHAVRGGTIVGEHEVMFALNDEVITFSHIAYSKTIFANGAIKAAEFIVDKKNGLFDMNDVFKF